MSRIKTPDIMGNVMGQKKIKQESHKAIKPVPKVKSTFTLTAETVLQLEDAWIFLKRSLNTSAITKTLLVETAIEIMIKDLTELKELSTTFRQISNKAIKPGNHTLI
jgi:hypothetical protein